jgi:hypothetical protein
MEVRSGWNSEYARKKYDVTVDEGDLARILIAAGIPVAAQPGMTADDAHMILYTTAEIMARRTLVQFDPSQKEKLVAEARALNAQRAAVLDRVKKAWVSAHE